MSASVSMKLKPFNVPNFAVAEMPPGLREHGYRESPSFPLHELPVETLDTLCAQFRAEVFAKAKKKDPHNTPPERGEGGDCG